MLEDAIFASVQDALLHCEIPEAGALPYVVRASASAYPMLQFFHGSSPWDALAISGALEIARLAGLEL